MARLRSLNYVNDESFARNWARARAEGRGYGPRRVEQELRAKGIARVLARLVISETFGQGASGERAKILLEKRFKGKDLSDPRIVRRAVAFLDRRGYGGDVIIDLLRRPAEEY